MKTLFKYSLLIATLFTILASCSHHEGAQRSVATESCLNSVKPEYQSYFDSVEKCLEKEPQK